MGKKTAFLMGIIISFFLLSSNSFAYNAPYYSYGETWTHDYSISPYPNDSSAFEGPSGGNIYSGTDIWNWGVGTVVPGDYAQGGQIQVNPATGVIQGQTETFGYNAITGDAAAYGYMSQAFRVTSDGSLNTGESVSVQANLVLDGEFSGRGLGNVQGFVFLNKIDNSAQNLYYHNYDYLDWGTADQISWDSNMTDAMLGLISFERYKTDSAGFNVNINETISGDVAVGDIVLIETMLWIETNAHSTSDVEYNHADFANTLSSQLSSLTAGATLEPVPVPPSALLIGVGLAGLVGLRRKK